MHAGPANRPTEAHAVHEGPVIMHTALLLIMSYHEIAAPLPAAAAERQVHDRPAVTRRK